MPEGRRPEGTDSSRGNFLTEEKNAEVEAAISLYLARLDPIYIINISTCTSTVKDRNCSLFGLVVTVGGP